MSNFVIFQGTSIPYVEVNGEYYIAIKPICQAIGLRHDSAFEAIKNDEILSQLYGVHRTTGRDGKSYEMSCLPLDYINGWLFTIDDKKVGEQAREKLLAYKRECYRALYARFFGSLQVHEQAKALHHEILQAEVELKEARLAHKNSDTAKRVMAAKENLACLQARQMELNCERYGDTLALFPPTQ